MLIATLAICAFAIMSISTVTLGAFLLIVGVVLWLTYEGEKRFLHSLTPITATSHPALWLLAHTAADRLSMPMPPVYICEDARLNAYAAGFFMPPIVVLNSGTVERLPSEYVLFILGHEMSHVKCGHVTWLTLTNTGGSAITNRDGSRGLSAGFSVVVAIGGVYGADRGGILACRNLDHAIGPLESDGGGIRRHNRTSGTAGGCEGNGLQRPDVETPYKRQADHRDRSVCCIHGSTEGGRTILRAASSRDRRRSSRQSGTPCSNSVAKSSLRQRS